jgi:hypothetical protein
MHYFEFVIVSAMRKQSRLCKVAAGLPRRFAPRNDDPDV